ncbi:hypothetical protein [Vibrio parahaemolyticus]|jgi:hypothetical protein|uniref:hypothetical protein n=1 Tax=Vibrio parahaemolyticus TaxID=670 RepID=UPI000B2A54D3|nr:hypothetical protein [Vibrio parahaemolyticus]
MPHDFLDKKKKPLSSSGGGYKPLHDEEALKKPPVREETVRERAARQRRERQAELTFTQEDYDRWARNRERVIAERQQVTFELGWMQSPVTQSQNELWESLFTSETTEEQKQTIKQCNVHLNDPVRQGEIVLLPTTQPQTSEEQSLLDKWLEEAKIASVELGKLLDEEVATLNRHFELFSHQLDERIRTDGLPTDFYAQVGTGVGATAALVEQNLKNIQNVLLEINNLYVSQVAMASRTGGMGMNYGAFVADRADLFKKLDGSFAMLSKRSVQLPIYTQIKRNLKLSTKSVIYHADEILKTGFVKELGKRIGNIAIGISAARGLGYVGLVIGAASGMSNIYEACKVDSTGNCGKTTTREIGGFIGGFVGGSIGAELLTGGVMLVLGVVGVSSAPVLAIAAIGSFVVGGAVGGVAGATTGKWGADFIYESAESALR